MDKLVCTNCNKPAHFQKIRSTNIAILFCKDCAINEKQAKPLSNKAVVCDTCGKPAEYIAMDRTNRVKNYCSDCLFSDFTKL